MSVAPRGAVVQIWFADPAGNTIEIQQDPDLHPCSYRPYPGTGAARQSSRSGSG